MTSTRVIKKGLNLTLKVNFQRQTDLNACYFFLVKIDQFMKIENVVCY